MPGAQTPAKPGSPVPPPGPTCTLKGIASFRPGVWNDVPVSAADLKDMAETFAELRGYYKPYLSLNHDDGLSFGNVSDLRIDGDILRIDADNVPAEVGSWVNGGRLQAPSIEFWEPGDFRMPDGTPNKSRVFKCLTLLGNQPPGVKGLGPLPAATFGDRGKAKRFSGATNMDRTAMLAALQAAGVDVTLITDAIPDPVLDAWLKSLQAAAQPATPVTNADPAGTGTAGGVGGVTPPVPAVAPVPGAVQPSAVTIKFNDRHGRLRTGTYQDMFDDVAAGFAEMRANNAAVVRTNEQLLTDAKRAKVKRFRDEMTGNRNGFAFMTPVEFDAIEPMLLDANDVAVRKFADGKATGTALDEHMARIKAAHPKPVRKFGDQVADPVRGNGTLGSIGNETPSLTPERRKEILGGSPVGRAVLAGERKK